MRYLTDDEEKPHLLWDRAYTYGELNDWPKVCFILLFWVFIVEKYRLLFARAHQYQVFKKIKIASIT